MNSVNRTLDMVSEGYKGKMGEKVAISVKKRIHWVVNNTIGEEVLDVGCSQGIASILLASKGKNVTGIDNEIESIAYANREKANAEEHVKKQIDFVCDDFLTHQFEKNFDTIILGEILEHVYSPELFLKKAVELLNDEGRIIVTVPFGINRFPDHKRTYYFLEIFNQINEYISVKSINFFGRWIGFIADKKLNHTCLEVSEELLRNIENAFFFIDSENNDKIELLQNECNDKSNKIEKNMYEIEKLESEISLKKEELLTENGKYEELHKLFQFQNKTIDGINQKNNELELNIESLKSELSIKENALQRLNNQEKEIKELVHKKADYIKLQRNQINKLSNAIKELENVNNNKELLLKKLKNQFVSKKAYNQYLRKLIEEKESELKEVKQYISELEDIVSTTEIKIKQLSEEMKIEINKKDKVIRDERNNNILLMEKIKSIPVLSREIDALKKEKEKLSADKKLLQKDIMVFNTQAYQYKMEYQRLLDSKSVKLIFRLKRMFGHPYVEKYIGNDISLIEEDVSLNETEDRTYVNSDIKSEYIELFEDRTSNMLQSNGCKYYNPYDVNIGIICDRFLYDAWKDAANFLYITPDNWEEQLTNCDILLIVTTWHGLNNEWEFLASKTSTTSAKVIEIIDEFNMAGKKTVFYSKEDPDSFNEFLHLAQKCQYIFTGDAESIDNYKASCNTQNVNCLTFCINPLYHNPIGMNGILNGVVFSGSWMERFPERCKDQKEIFDGVILSGNDLTIIDRNFSLNNSRYVFPNEYHKYVVPDIEHDKLQKVHKLYDWAINLNSAKSSTTVFANRAYELQANGNLIISNYSVGMFNLLPYIFIANSKKEVNNILESFTKEEIDERKSFGIRFVMNKETCFDRVLYMLNQIGVDVKPIKRKVCVVADLIDDNIQTMFDIQTYKEKTLISYKEYDESTHKEYDIIAFFNNHMKYDMFYLEDMINAFKYTSCDYITKDAYYCGKKLKYGKEHQYVSKMKNKYRTVFWADAFTAEQLKAINGKKYINNGYSIDRFNFNEKNNEIESDKNSNVFYKISVIIPTYNNGDFLYGKAFASLKRSKLFNEMEIIIVDDGSTDEYTPNLIRYIAERYSNVKTYFYNDGGSGSASRPRNKGVEIASSELIAFIDPDNEVIGSAYEEMYEIVKRNDELDFVCGNMLIMRENAQKWNFYSYLANNKEYCMKMEGNRYAIIKGNNTLLKDCNFMGIQMQAALVKKSFLESNNLRQIEGAAGEDTLFAWEWIKYSKLFAIVNDEMSVYYAGRSDSIVNSINKRFFERYLKVEKPRRNFLEKNNLLNIYMGNRFNGYFKGWDLKYLSMVGEEDEIECIKYVEEIFNIYRDVYLKNDDIINKFVELCDNNSYHEIIPWLRKVM